jgi:hypothetical protein
MFFSINPLNWPEDDVDAMRVDTSIACFPLFAKHITPPNIRVLLDILNKKKVARPRRN